MQAHLPTIIYLLKKKKYSTQNSRTASGFTTSQFRHSKCHWGFKSFFQGTQTFGGGIWFTPFESLTLKIANKHLKKKQGSEQVPEYSHDKLVKTSTERSHEVWRHGLSTGFYILTMEVKESTARYWPRSCASLLQHKLNSEQFKKQNKKHKRKKDEKGPLDLAQMPITLAIRWPPWIQLWQMGLQQSAAYIGHHEIPAS